MRSDSFLLSPKEVLKFGVVLPLLIASEIQAEA